MNETIKNLMERRSIRKYKDIQITEEQLDQILEAGKYAPSGKGAQSPCMVVIQNRELIQKLSAMNAEVLGNPAMDPLYGAPTVIVVFAHKELPTYIEDGSLVMGNLMNAAHAVGVDSCWVHRAKQVFESEKGKELLKEWGIEEDYAGIGHCILGYRDCEYPSAKERKENYVVRIK